MVKAPGTGSVTPTLAAVEGPRLVTMIVKVTLLPTVTGEGDAVCEIARSAAALTVVTTDAELLPVEGSGTAEKAVAVLVIVPARAGRTVISSERMPLTARAPQEAYTVPALLLAEPPALGTTEMKLAPAGKGLVTKIPVTLTGPRLVTKIE